ncbi:DUF433 domain-containing protein [Nodosilinea sp. P-1105]|uniref:DUF433 domain-containing protein n=1 Tax=Nodosilinea sp. P-1105 TaxID=2546229 RepID=UPI00146A0592|nr:DUF433 domain-containing protein [Nodosilinea sp. P-1105]NMF81787.1 DUF433 domain-containing protein [Nodosilinea sp. P-1105]
METKDREGRSPLGRIALGAGDNKPVIRGQTVLVEAVLRKLADGATYEAVLAEWPQLQREDILACLEYAARLVVYRQLRESDLPPD